MRLGYETGAWNGLSLQADFDQIWLMAGNYNSSGNGKTSYPVIADPAMTALNRLQLTYASDYDTKLARARSSRCRARRECPQSGHWRATTPVQYDTRRHCHFAYHCRCSARLNESQERR